MNDLYGHSLLTIFLVGLAVILAVSEIGWQLGVRGAGRGGTNVPMLESAALGLDTTRARSPVYIMGILVSAVILLILDLDRPSSGFITNNQQSMIDTAATIAAFSK